MSVFMLLFFLLTAIRGQFHLESMNRCLGNCAVCRNDDLAACSGREMLECVKGYNGVNCAAKQTFAAQLTLIDSVKLVALPSIWQNASTAQCSYVNNKMEKTTITIVGMYTRSQWNTATVPINPNYQNYIISFNLIRGSWTPFSDSLRVVIFDQFDVEIQDYFIEFPSRNEINPDVNLLRCNKNQPKMIEKFQIEGIIDHTKQNKLVIKFEGDIFSGSDWGLTNVKILFGCSKFLIFSGNECNKCVDGYYEISTIENSAKRVLGCQPCPLNCSKCSDNLTCQTCSEGFVLSNGKCRSNNTVAAYVVPGRTLTCPNNRNLLPSVSMNGQERLQFEIKTWPPHRVARLIFWVAYVPDSVSSNTKLGVEIDGITQIELSGSKLKGVDSRAKQSCAGFGTKGYFSLYKVITPYMNHIKPTMNVSIWGVSSGKLGAWDMLLEYEPLNQTIENPNNTSPTNTTNTTLMNDSNSRPSSVNTTNTTNNSSNVSNNSDWQNNNTIVNNTEQNSTGNNMSGNNISSNSSDRNTSSTNQSTNITNSTSNNNTSHNPDHSTNTNTSSNSSTTNNLTNITNNTNNNTSHNNNNNNSKNDSININNSNETEMIASIRKIQKVKSQIVFGLRLDRELIITITYPINISKFPHITARLSPHTTIPVVVEKQTPKYQELSLLLQDSLLDQKITLEMTNQHPLLTGRHLQNQQKPLVSNLGEVMVNRYDYLGQTQWDSINRYSTYFNILSWILIISTIVLSFFGNSVITMNTTLLLQIAFLHVYIYSEFLPTNFKNTIAGLQRMENLDYFTKEVTSSIESMLLGNVVQYSPPRFTSFNKDINFTRMVYPSVIILLAYLIFFLILTVVRKLIEPELMVPEIQQERTTWQKCKLFLIRVYERYLNYFYQIWQHNYIVYVWACCIQFHNMSYPSGADRSEVANMIFCFVVLVLMVVLPPATLVYLNKRYFRLDYFEYSYWYENLFFLLLPQESLPSNHHRVLIVIRNARYVILVACFAFLGNYPVQALVIIILTHFLVLLYMKITHLEIKPFNSILNFIEHGLLICLAVTMLVAYGTSSTFHTNQYMVIGHVLTTCCLLLTIAGIVRVFFNAYHKIIDHTAEKEMSQFKPAIGTERVV